MQAESDLYIDGDVAKGNVASFINNFIGKSEIGNVLWEFCMLPKPRNIKKWGYVITIASKDIKAGEELFAHYSLNTCSV